MIRAEDWVNRLDDYFKRTETLPFSLGANDCCLFAAGAVQAMTGVDLAARFRGKYRTEAGAMRILKRYADGDVRAMMTRMARDNALEEVTPLRLTRGSIALISHDGRESLGVISLTGAHILAPAVTGRAQFPLTRALTGWLI